jgi:hypothetical protein
VDTEPHMQLLERRWFAAMAAVKGVEEECSVLLAVLKLAEADWRNARSRLVELENLKEGLEQQMAQAEPSQPARHIAQRVAVMSAA